jgi:hypothetical protein
MGKHTYLKMLNALCPENFPAAKLNILSCHLFRRNPSPNWIKTFPDERGDLAPQIPAPPEIKQLICSTAGILSV